MMSRRMCQPLTTRKHIAGALVLGVCVGAFAMPAGAADLTAIKALYASASYEDALSQLRGLEGDVDADQIEQYRALCLIALDRTQEAERSLEEIVVRSPMFVVPD